MQKGIHLHHTLQTLELYDIRTACRRLYGTAERFTCNPLALTCSMVRYLRSSSPAINSSRISLYCSLMSSQKSTLFLHTTYHALRATISALCHRQWWLIVALHATSTRAGLSGHVSRTVVGHHCHPNCHLLVLCLAKYFWTGTMQIGSFGSCRPVQMIL